MFSWGNINQTYFLFIVLLLYVVEHGCFLLLFYCTTAANPSWAGGINTHRHCRYVRVWGVYNPMYILARMYAAHMSVRGHSTLPPKKSCRLHNLHRLHLPAMLHYTAVLIPPCSIIPPHFAASIRYAASTILSNMPHCNATKTKIIYKVKWHDPQGSGPLDSLQCRSLPLFNF